MKTALLPKDTLVAQIAKQSTLKKQHVDQMLKAFAQCMVDNLAELQAVRIPGLGTFEVRTRKARRGFNLKTGEPITIPETLVPRFSPADLLKTRVKQAAPAQLRLKARPPEKHLPNI